MEYGTDLTVGLNEDEIYQHWEILIDSIKDITRTAAYPKRGLSKENALRDVQALSLVFKSKLPNDSAYKSWIDGDLMAFKAWIDSAA